MRKRFICYTKTEGAKYVRRCMCSRRRPSVVRRYVGTIRGREDVENTAKQFLRIRHAEQDPAALYISLTLVTGNVSRSPERRRVWGETRMKQEPAGIGEREWWVKRVQLRKKRERTKRRINRKIDESVNNKHVCVDSRLNIACSCRKHHCLFLLILQSQRWREVWMQAALYSWAGTKLRLQQ